MATSTAPTAPAPTPVILPNPMSATTRARLFAHAEYPEKPTEHGCGYFDDGCPWNICYACEYERDPATYAEKCQRSQLIMQVCGYFRTVAHTFAGVKTETLQAIVTDLDKPRAERRYTDAAILAAAAAEWQPPAAGEDPALRLLRRLCGRR